MLPHHPGLLMNEQGNVHPLMKARQLRLVAWQLSGIHGSINNFQQMCRRPSVLLGRGNITNQLGHCGVSGDVKWTLIPFRIFRQITCPAVPYGPSDGREVIPDHWSVPLCTIQYPAADGGPSDRPTLACLPVDVWNLSTTSIYASQFGYLGTGNPARHSPVSAPGEGSVLGRITSYKCAFYCL